MARVLVILAASALLVLVGGTSGAAVATLTVNNPASGGPMTLRHAIESANSNPGPDVIDFDPAVFPPGSPVTINVSDALPEIDGTQGITIDGTGAGVIISGPNDEAGLRFGPSDGGIADVTVRNLTLKHFSPGMQAVSASLDDLVVQGLTVNEGEGSGISLVTGSDASDVQLSGLEFAGYGVDVIAGGMVTGFSLTDSAITGGDFYGLGLTVGSAIQGATISDASFTAIEGGGIDLTVGGPASGVTVSGVEASGNLMSGLSYNGDEVSGFVIEDSTFNGNGLPGISVTTGNATDVRMSGNTITGTQADGLSIIAGDATNVTITGNAIAGSDGSGMFVVLSSMAGVSITGNTVEDSTSNGVFVVVAGGRGEISGNTVSGSGTDGVAVAGKSLTISRNSTFENGQLGIDLLSDNTSEPDPGVTPNDAGDGDDGGNGLLNFPVFLQAGGSEGVLQGTACANCVIEIFEADGDASNHGEGQRFLGETTADGGGVFSFELCGLENGAEVTATATDANGNTSEFAENYTVDEALPGCLPVNGDVDCDGDVDGRDGLLLVTAAADVETDAQGPGCPEIGAGFATAGEITTGPVMFGDVNCSSVVDAADMVAVLRHAAGLPPAAPQPSGCAALGEALPGN